MFQHIFRPHRWRKWSNYSKTEVCVRRKCDAVRLIREQS